MKYILCALTILMLSCGGSSSKKVELTELDAKIEKHGERIINDFVSMSASDEEFNDFRKKGYIPPLVHRALMPGGIYFLAPIFVAFELGKINSFELYEVYDQGLVYHMRYKLDCEKRKNEFVELAIDVSKDLDLSKIYLKVENNGDFNLDKKYINLFSDDMKSIPRFKR